MNLNEAYKILGLSNGATPEETKKQYKKLTKQFHPDLNKEADAEAKFKKINEAYQIVTTGKDTDLSKHNVQYYPSNIEIQTTISFKESVLGCKQSLKFNRKIKCASCNGNGHYAKNNGCDKCGGRGQIVNRQGGMVMIITCDKCFGRVEHEPCNGCKASGVLEAEASISVNIPAGVQSGNVLRLAGMGNFSGMLFGQIEQHTDVFLHLTVVPEDGLQLVGDDVVSKLQISLLEALRGCKKSVKTINGEKQIEVNPKTRNRDEVIIPHLGVSGVGNQRVVLDVQYPDNIDQLIDTLSSQMPDIV